MWKTWFVTWQAGRAYDEVDFENTIDLLEG